MWSCWKKEEGPLTDTANNEWNKVPSSFPCHLKCVYCRCYEKEGNEYDSGW